jgi:AsmA protein
VIESPSITSHDLDPAKLAAYYPPLKKTLGGEVSGPIGLSVKGSGSKDAQVLELRLDLTPVRLSLPAVLTKAAGGVMTLVAHARGAAATNGPVKFDVAVDLAGVDLRPGESVDKGPGQRLDLSVSGTRAGEKIEIADLKVHILDDELEGHGKADLTGGMKKFELALQSSHLDLDKLLLPSKPKADKPPLDPKTFAGIDGRASVRIDQLTMSKQVMTGIVAEVVMKDDDIKVTKAQLTAFGGSADASGTELRLAHPQEPFHVVTHLKGVELENAVALFTPHKLLSGKFNGDIDLKGGGQLKAELLKTLAGQLDGHVLDGNFFGKDLIGSVTGPLVKALPSQLTGRVTQGGTTSLGHDLPMGIKFANGVAELSRPLSVTRPEAVMSFTGGIHLDGMLDLPGKIELTPATLSQITAGRVKLQQNLPFTVRLTGPAWSPQIEGLDVKPAIAMILKEAGANLLGRALGVDNVDQKKAQLEQQAQQRAQDEAKKAEQKIQDEAANKLKGLFGR